VQLVELPARVRHLARLRPRLARQRLPRALERVIHRRHVTARRRLRRIT